MSRAAAALLALLVPPLLPAARGDCVPPPRLSFAELVTSLDSYRIGTEVTYRCRPGFIRADGKAPVITCQANSTWSQHSEFCVAIPCLPPPEVANGTHSGEGEGYVFGSSVTYTCKSGFRLIGEASIHCTTEDNLNGVWSPAPQCKVQCGLLPTTTGAKPSRSSLSKSFPIGTRVTYVCLEGFLQIPDKSNTVECLSSLEWSKLPELCGRSCLAPGGLLFAKVSEEDERRSFYPVRTTVSYVCRNGYERVPGQDSTRTCLEDLTWSKPPEFCTKKSCGVPEAPAHGRIPDTTRTLFGDTARIVCDEGYRLSGSHIACRLKGREVAWSQPPTCVAIPCLPPPEVANGAHSGEGEGYVFGSSVTYTCKSGFRLVGEASIHCTTEDNLNGVWSPAPQCKEVTCSAPAVPNGKKKFGSVAVYSYGDTIIFECNPGYTLRGGGDGVIRCMEDNTWKPSVPICDPVQCGPLPTIRGAKPSRSDVPESFPVGTRVMYMCLEGFLQIPDRSDTIECLSSLEWSQLPELCGRSCPAPRGLPFAKVSEEDERRSFYLVGTTVSYVCRNGYERVPGQDSTRTCLEDLTWSEPPEFCTRPGAYSTEEVQHKSGLGANSSEEEAQPESGHLVGITLGVLVVLLLLGCAVCIAVICRKKEKGSYDIIETAMTEPHQGDLNYFMRKTGDTMNERYVDGIV